MKRNGFMAALCLGAALMTGCAGSGKQESKAPVAAGNAAAVQTGAMTVATVNTDTLFAQYKMVVDVTDELDKTEKKLQADLQKQAQDFQTEYENYLKVGATMTLSEQRKKEEYLTKKRESLEQLSARYETQLVTLRLQRMEEVQNAVFEFIERYNAEHGQYTFVISNARTSGVLYSPANIDITDEVLAAINAEYGQKKGKK
ncbi:MAG: OmpH family outer membrane protein [Bacteroidales bacterium]|nr:OmpH family outer membrane protein [Bacteroidales bacterium]MDE6106509.1 OmpH family outer membrane protein [Bacteroidales bacterium]MDE6112812.1 OmpH family outer membrane protein [Bacteroidales bacterium]MDE6308446.1 OmpH family outer membrane protein [Bacteroidales bacterium]